MESHGPEPCSNTARLNYPFHLCVYPPLEETEKKHRCSGLRGGGEERDERLGKTSKALPLSPRRDVDCTFNRLRNPS